MQQLAFLAFASTVHNNQFRDQPLLGAHLREREYSSNVPGIALQKTTVREVDYTQ